MNSDLIWGLRNAIERGYSLEQAAKSFVSAGYSEIEVQEAIRILTSGSGSLMAAPQDSDQVQNNKLAEIKKVSAAQVQVPQKIVPAPGMVIARPAVQTGPASTNMQGSIAMDQKMYAPIMPATNYQIYTPPVPQKIDEEENLARKKKRKNVIIILVVLLILLIAMLAGIIIFSDKILEYLAGT